VTRGALVAVVAVVVAASVVAGCAETTIDTSRTTTVSLAGPSSTLFSPTGPAIELLPELSTELSRLGALIVDNEGDEESLARIDALWAAARAEVAEQRPDLVSRFERAVALARTGVERRRPADADKAFRNLTALVDAYVGDG
jgi:hypothetical protein